MSRIPPLFFPHETKKETTSTCSFLTVSPRRSPRLNGGSLMRQWLLRTTARP